MARVSVRIANLAPYVFARMDRVRRELVERGVDVISLAIGDPVDPTPAYVVEALREAAADPATHRYPPYEGTHEFRCAVARRYRERFGVEVDPEREVFALIGSKEGLAHLIWAYIDPGDVAILPDPAYPVYAAHVRMCGGEAHVLPLTPANGFRPPLSSIPSRVAGRAKLLFLNYPHNPTSAVVDLDYFRQAVEFAHLHGVLICHDAAYVENTYDGYRAPSVLQVPGAKQVALELYSLSKPFNMTGWRIAAAVGSADAISALARVKTNTDSGQFAAIQHAAAVALTRDPDGFIQHMNSVYRERRDLVVSALRAMGLNAPCPSGGLYVWLPVPEGLTDEQFAATLLEKAGVLVTPGSTYGQFGQGFVRISLTVPTHRIRQAMERMADVLGKLR